MKRHPTPRGSDRQRLASIIDDLSVPAPFTMNMFRSRLEDITRGDIHLSPVAFPPGACTGLRLARNGAEHLCYESRTSPFHQAHIVVGLATGMLLAGSGPLVDARLTAGLEPTLVRRILGDQPQLDADNHDADICSYLLLERPHPTVSRAEASRMLRHLGPLRMNLARAVPAARGRPMPEGRAAVQFRLYWTVTQIRDLLLALRLSSERGGQTLASDASWLIKESPTLHDFLLGADRVPPRQSAIWPGRGAPFVRHRLSQIVNNGSYSP